jgi:hypothetical protein
MVYAYPRRRLPRHATTLRSMSVEVKRITSGETSK